MDKYDIIEENGWRFIMGRLRDFIKDDIDFSKKYCEKYLREEDELLFEITDVLDKLNINLFTIITEIISLFVFDGLFFGSKLPQYVIGVGRLNIYVLYLGKYNITPSVDEFKPVSVQIIGLDSIRGINVKKTAFGLFYKITILAEEEDKTFYVGFGEEKSHMEYMQYGKEEADKTWKKGK